MIRRVLRPLLLAWASAPLALGVALAARIAIDKATLGRGTQWRVVEGGGPVPGSDHHDGIEDVLGDGTYVHQQLATVEVVGAAETQTYPALLLDVSGVGRVPRLKAIRSAFFGAEPLDLGKALETSLGRVEEARRLIDASEDPGRVRMSFGGGSAYANRSLVRAIVLEPGTADDKASEVGGAK